MEDQEYRREVSLSAQARRQIAEEKALRAYLIQVAQTGENSPKACELKGRLQRIQQTQ